MPAVEVLALLDVLGALGVVQLAAAVEVPALVQLAAVEAELGTSTCSAPSPWGSPSST